MFTKNKIFLSKSKYFLLATSSIGLLASTEALAVVDITPVTHNTYPVNYNAHIGAQYDWKYNGKAYLPQDNDNVILTANNQQINFDSDINIGNINLYGFTSGGLVIFANDPTNQVSINNIVNFNDQQARTAAQSALGVPLAYGGNKDAKVQIRLLQIGAEEQSQLTIKGDNISAVDSILLDGASATLIFEKPITVTAPIYSSAYNRGIIKVKNNAVFEAPIGHDGIKNYSIYVMTVDDNKTVTLKSDIYATDIVLEKDSKLIIDSSKQNIKVNSGVAVDSLGGMNDGDGIIQVKGGAKNTITFINDIGSEYTRVGEINIERGKKTEFNNNVYAKSIKVASNDVEFKEKLAGNLEITNHAQVKFHKDFAGDITAKMPKLGRATFVNTPDIYRVGKNKKIEQLIFEGNHIHNLHKNIHAERINFDSGTYNITTKDIKIDGNANVNGSTLNLNKHNLIFIEKVEFSNNINLFVTGGNKLIFKNHAPTVDNKGANIIITIDGAQPANEGTALAAFKVDVGVFPPVGSHYDAARGILVLPGLGGAIPAGPVRAPVPVVAAPAPGGAVAAAAPPAVVGVPAGGGAAAAPVGPAPGGVAAPAPGGAVAAAVPPPAVVPAPGAAAGAGIAVAAPAPGGGAAPAAPGGVAAPAAPGGVAAPAPAGVPAPGGAGAAAPREAAALAPAGAPVPGGAAPPPTPVVAAAPTPAAPVVVPIIELANAISNIVVSAKQGATANKATQEVINKRAVSVMQNPEKHATELAKELASSGADFKEAARVANDDAYVTGKTKQEQSLLFAATLSQIAPDKQDEAVKHLTDQATRSVSVANVTTEAVGANITNHLSGSNTAIAAGDEDDNSILSSKKGIWVAGTFGSSNQGIYKGGASYNGKVAGTTIGGDLYIGDNGVVGIAYSNMSSNFKFTGANPRDKLSANSNVISIYGQQQFNNGFMLQGIFSGSNSKITKKDSRQVGASIYKLAIGKYTNKAYAFETTVGYQVSTINDISLMPNIGIRYNSYKDEAYTETGTGVNNTYVPAKSGNMVTGIAGMKITMSKKLSEDTQIIPGLHASIENSFNNKQQKVKARFIWADNYFENAATASTPKVGYNLGASLLTKHKNIELLATYNCNLRSKYHSHQGSLKLKLLF
ncbi:autotransporter outer membrane beta-barrel domain-containing protein [Rickettsia endosymbiont of Polydrusus tereticollis]|uniref:autotransporter outer membrane beta-barrel domain-containing protein n=1 Tax=Rickettsia endosymbiont of Polydrusus tereticollis TaxID=3066251 RepID=UPI0031331933